MESITSPQVLNGSIELIFGPMFSGKSTELLRRIRRQTIANKKCIVIKFNADTRYSVEKLSTHDKQMWSALPSDKLSLVENECLNYDVIGVDEGQFFPDTVQFAEKMANAGKQVIVAALDGTFQRRPFGNILDLVPLAENVTKLKAVCMMCYEDASFSKRIAASTEVQLIGGAESYISTCRACYSKPQPVSNTVIVAPTTPNHFITPTSPKATICRS